MYIDTVPNRNSRPAILLREGWREGKRVRKRTIANLSKWPPDKIQRLRLVLRTSLSSTPMSSSSSNAPFLMAMSRWFSKPSAA